MPLNGQEIIETAEAYASLLVEFKNQQLDEEALFHRLDELPLEKLNTMYKEEVGEIFKLRPSENVKRLYYLQPKVISLTPASSKSV